MIILSSLLVSDEAEVIPAYYLGQCQKAKSEVLFHDIRRKRKGTRMFY